MGVLDKALMTYEVWFLAGPDCPPARPFVGNRDQLATLPDSLRMALQSCEGHWWLEDHKRIRRQFVTLEPRAAISSGVARCGDGGNELNLRSHNAQTRSQPLFAYLLNGEIEELGEFGVSGKFSSFHLIAQYARECTDRIGNHELGMSGHVYRLSREKSPGSPPIRFLMGTAPDSAANKVAKSYDLLPGIVRLTLRSDELANCLDIFVSDGDPSSLTRTEAEGRDLLFSLPLVSAADESDTFDESSWRLVAMAMFSTLRTAAPMVDDWPPLLRLVATCLEPGLRELILENHALEVHLYDTTAKTLCWKPQPRDAISLYRQWMLIDSPNLSETDDGWRNKVVINERKAFFRQARKAGGWERILRTQTNPVLLNQLRSPDPAWPEHGYSGRLTASMPSPDASLRTWLDWLETMPEGERRAGFGEVLALLTCINDLLIGLPSAIPESKAVCLLKSCVTPGDAPGTVLFFHDLCIVRLADRLLSPAVAQLRSSIRDKSIVLRRCIYLMFSFFLGDRTCYADWVSTTSAATAHLRQVFSANFSTDLFNDGRHGIALPMVWQEALIAKLMLPPGRIRSRGFRLGYSRLQHPCCPL